MYKDKLRPILRNARNQRPTAIRRRFWRGCRTLAGTLSAFLLAGLAAADPPSPVTSPSAANEDRFEQVAAIFGSHCVTCHNANITEGGLSLSSRQHALAGGESGAVIVAGQPDDSILLDYVRGPAAYMPPEGKPLTDQQVAVLEAWIAEGAKWPEGRQVVESHLQDRSWWSLRRLQPVAVPEVAATDPDLTSWPRNAIDRFVLRRLLAADLRPAPEADRRTLIRRLYFDLLGLPPSPQAVERFVRDPRPDAYERLVDHLLASPRYGERWARHWLDVVHYGDTHGYDKDKPRPHAWPYRDYVIRSMNQDKPWSRFLREQIAGDAFYPHARDGNEALGFLAAGPWDFVGHAEVSEEKIDGQIARHLDRDDMVRTTMQSFMGLTVGCAQCHNHKFDPITQRDYYQLHAVFAAIDRADRTYDRDPLVHEQRQTLTQGIAAEQQKIDSLRQRASGRIAAELTTLDEAIAKAKQDNFGPAFGYHSSIAPEQTATKWVQIDLGQPQPLRQIVLHPCKDDFNGIGAGFGFPMRFRVQASNDEDFRDSAAVTTIADQTAADFANPGLAEVVYDVDGQAARYVRITATKLAPRQNDFIFALAEVKVLDTAGRNRAAGGAVTSLDSIEAAPRWQRANLTDGEYPRAAGDPDALRRQRDQRILAAMTSEERERMRQAKQRLQTQQQRLAALPEPSKVYAGTVFTGSGNFKGTGAAGGRPRPIHLLIRGDVRQPAQVVTPGALSVLGLDQHFRLEASHSEADRRAALARWLSDAENPVTWRNIVNRVWQYHFGRGLVETPNDFGRMGGVPSHPELLDHLAIRFRDSGQSLKQLHRLILCSATWRQASRPRESLAARAHDVDAENRLLWAMPRRKLDAEAVRDSVLLVSGKLNLSMYGPGFRNFVLKHPEHSPHYEYHLHDPNDPATQRRSVYRFVVRSQLEPFMTTLDCADPSILVGRRNQSVTPLQALAMLNSGLMVTMADHFAAKLQRQHERLADQVRAGFREAIGRPPDKAEQIAIVDVARQHGLANACRLMFNLNEFSFVD
ncbi:DUF1553 domain-containing protein [Roseimaritima sediminicola]|uniref:DUF1553 domain-containing protein n=1 Tax=Roseimaritima sediminicola TaxID=2662066 RepID=UPI0012983052|nr:DUF1553 domain-containing protein [Roseimaritima sediminicola]